MHLHVRSLPARRRLAAFVAAAVVMALMLPALPPRQPSTEPARLLSPARGRATRPRTPTTGAPSCCPRVGSWPSSTRTSGQTLAWRDPDDSSWTTKSIYSNQADDVANDRPASIALDGAGSAWVVLSGYNFAKISGVKLRRLTDLDAAAGPTLGPIAVVESAGRGNVFADLAFQGGRGPITWLQRTGDTQYQLKVAWFSPTTDAPAFEDRAVLFTGPSASSVSTLVPTSSGMRVVAKVGKLKVFAHQGGAEWTHRNRRSQGAEQSEAERRRLRRRHPRHVPEQQQRLHRQGRALLQQRQ